MPPATASADAILIRGDSRLIAVRPHRTTTRHAAISAFLACLITLVPGHSLMLIRGPFSPGVLGKSDRGAEFEQTRETCPRKCLSDASVFGNRATERDSRRRDVRNGPRLHSNSATSQLLRLPAASERIFFGYYGHFVTSKVDVSYRPRVSLVITLTALY